MNFLLVPVSKESKVKRPFFVVVVVVAVVVPFFSPQARCAEFCEAEFELFCFPGNSKALRLGSTMVNPRMDPANQFPFERHVKNICFGGYHTPSVYC